MCEGKSNSVIAQILEISSSSVDMYVRRIFAKLDVTDRTAACLRGYSLGLTVTGEYHRFLEDAQRRDPGGRFRDIPVTQLRDVSRRGAPPIARGKRR